MQPDNWASERRTNTLQTMRQQTHFHDRIEMRLQNGSSFRVKLKFPAQRVDVSLDQLVSLRPD